MADAARIVRVAELGGSSMRAAEVDPFYDPLEDTLDDLASEWSGASALWSKRGDLIVDN